MASSGLIARAMRCSTRPNSSYASAARGGWRASSRRSGSSFALALRIEERLLRHLRRRAPPAVLDGELDFQLARISLEVRQGNVFLQQRRPDAARRVADLLSA